MTTPNELRKQAEELQSENQMKLKILNALAERAWPQYAPNMRFGGMVSLPDRPTGEQVQMWVSSLFASTAQVIAADMPAEEDT